MNLKSSKTILGAFLLVAIAVGIRLSNSASDRVFIQAATEEKLPTNIIDNRNTPKTEKEVKVQSTEVNAANVVYLAGPISKFTAISVSDQLEKAGRLGEAVYLVIDSPGGSVLAGGEILTAMQSLTVPVYTVCKGMCASMAFVIHQYGTKRYATPRSVLMAHQATGGASGTIEQMDSLITFLKRFLSKSDAFIAKRAGLSPEVFQSMYKNELWLDAEDAVNMKFADGLIYFRVLSEYSVFGASNASEEDEEQKIKTNKLDELLPNDWPTKNLESFK